MSAAERKSAIKNADMSEEMQQDAVECASQVGNADKFSRMRLEDAINNTYIIDKSKDS